MHWIQMNLRMLQPWNVFITNSVMFILAVNLQLSTSQNYYMHSSRFLY